MIFAERIQISSIVYVAALVIIAIFSTFSTFSTFCLSSRHKNERADRIAQADLHSNGQLSYVQAQNGIEDEDGRRPARSLYERTFNDIRRRFDNLTANFFASHAGLSDSEAMLVDLEDEMNKILSRMGMLTVRPGASLLTKAEWAYMQGILDDFSSILDNLEHNYRKYDYLPEKDRPEWIQRYKQGTFAVAGKLEDEFGQEILKTIETNRRDLTPRTKRKSKKQSQVTPLHGQDSQPTQQDTSSVLAARSNAHWWNNAAAWIFGGILVAAVLILARSFGRLFRTLFVGCMAPVAVPESHFVGDHGKNESLIIFVHGVMGDMDNTWVNAETKASWPDMMKDDDELKQFDVFVYGYASPKMNYASSIEQIAVRFQQDLKDSGYFQSYSELHFITHSMGGIITKRMLNMLNNPKESSLLQKVHSVIYISVPSSGANIAAVQSWLSRNPQFKGMDPHAAYDFLQNIEGDWANMLRHRTTSLPHLRTYSAYETLPTGPMVVVDQLYTSELSDERVIGFDYNHIEIVKPKNRDAQMYRWVKARLLNQQP